jgi:hypothetical protein
MGYSLVGILEYRDADSPLVQSFCGPVSLGNDSTLINVIRRELADSHNLLNLSYDAIAAMTIEVADIANSQTIWKPTVTPQTARAWVNARESRWVSIDWDTHSVVPSDTETAMVLHPDMRNGQIITPDDIAGLDAAYRLLNADEGEEVAVAAGEPLPEGVIGYLGHDDAGRSLLLVHTQEGIASYWLERIKAIMDAAAHAGCENLQLRIWLT